MSRQGSEIPQGIWEHCRDHPPLPEGQTLSLLHKIQHDGDEQALNRIVEHNLRFVVMQAMKYCRRLKDAEASDLIGVGTVGIINAAKKFDLSSQVRFLTYAKFHLVQQVQLYIREKYQIAKVPVRAYYHMRNGHGGKETAQQSELSRMAGNAVKAAIPLHEKVDLSGNTFGDVGGDGRGCLGGFSATPIDDDRRNHMLSAIESLPPRWRTVMVMRVYDELSGEDVAKELGVSRQAVLKTERRAAEAVKMHLYIKGVLDRSPLDA
jgi:RNA polymerase sigma factor (sigma-70 family)